MLRHEEQVEREGKMAKRETEGKQRGKERKEEVMLRHAEQVDFQTPQKKTDDAPAGRWQLLIAAPHKAVHNQHPPLGCTAIVNRTATATIVATVNATSAIPRLSRAHLFLLLCLCRALFCPFFLCSPRPSRGERYKYFHCHLPILPPSLPGPPSPRTTPRPPLLTPAWCKQCLPGR